MNKGCGLSQRVVPVVATLGAVFLCGCVHLAGTAGYWNAGPDGQPVTKQTGFDTDQVVNKGKTPGSVTF